MLNQLVADMQNQLVEAKKQVAVQSRTRSVWKNSAMSRPIWSRSGNARPCWRCAPGDDSLAREALKRKSEHEAQAAEFIKQTQLQKDAVEKLKEQLRTLNDKIEEAKRKKNILIARQKRAEAQKAIQDTMQGLSDTSAFDTFERMAQKVDQIEAESEASVELGGELSGDTLQQKFKALESGGAGTDSALAELKAKMGLAPAAAAKAALPAQVTQDESRIPSVLTTENRNK